MIHLVQYEPENVRRDDIVVYRTTSGAKFLVCAALAVPMAILSYFYGVPHQGGRFAAEIFASIGIILFVVGGFGCRIVFKKVDRRVRLSWYFLSVKLRSQDCRYDEFEICIRHYAWLGWDGEEAYVDLVQDRLYIMMGKDMFVIASDEYKANQCGLNGLRQKVGLDSVGEAPEVSEYRPYFLGSCAPTHEKQRLAFLWLLRLCVASVVLAIRDARRRILK